MNAVMFDSVTRKSLGQPRRLHGGGVLGTPVATTIFPTELGWMAVAGRDGVLVNIDFGYPSEERAASVLATRLSRTLNRPAGVSTPDWLNDVASLLTRYAQGDSVDFLDVFIDVEHLTPFARRVVAACRNIPRGATRTYGELAGECGSPGAARAVGSVMAKNRYPLVVPCHRVVGAAGSLGGYSAPDGLAMKRRLLKLESGTIGAS